MAFTGIQQAPAGEPPASIPAGLEPLQAVSARFIPAPPKRFAEFKGRAILLLLKFVAKVYRDIWPFCTLWPVPTLRGLRLVLRHDHVREVLSRHDVFRVPFDKEIARLNDGSEPGTPFLLGVDDPEEHARQAKLLMAVFPLWDIKSRVAEVSARMSAKRMREGGAPFDAIRELITAVPVDVCEAYYGVEMLDEAERRSFALAAIALSGHLFGAPPIKPKDAQVEAAGTFVRAVVDRSIARAVMRRPTEPHTVLERLLAACGCDPAGRRQVRAMLVGMIVGFVPTNTRAGGFILEMLLRKPEMMKFALRAVKAGDDEGLMQCLFEALRFMPINPGPFRLCARDHAIGGTRIYRGETVFAMTSSAMFDKRQVLHPRRYDPSRPASNHMHFGFGMHWCIGAMIARAQITHTFKALLSLGEPQRLGGLRGRLAYRDSFPERLLINIDGS
jgi:cytochrome P450